MKKLEELSVQEKLRLICGKDFWHTEDFDGKLPQLSVSDGPVGLRTERQEGGESTTIPAVAFSCGTLAPRAERFSFLNMD